MRRYCVDAQVRLIHSLQSALADHKLKRLSHSSSEQSRQACSRMLLGFHQLGLSHHIVLERTSMHYPDRTMALLPIQHMVFLQVQCRSGLGLVLYFCLLPRLRERWSGPQGPHRPSDNGFA